LRPPPPAGVPARTRGIAGGGARPVAGRGLRGRRRRRPEARGRATGRGHEDRVTPDSLLARVGIDPSGVRLETPPHNRWLTPAIWIVSDGSRRLVLKHVTAERAAGATAWDAHWTAGAHEPRHW